jgi:hypothetical protein
MEKGYAQVVVASEFDEDWNWYLSSNNINWPDLPERPAGCRRVKAQRVLDACHLRLHGRNRTWHRLHHLYVRKWRKDFARGTVVTQNTGTGKLTSSTAASVTGGTGKVLGIQGLVRTSTTSDPKAGLNEGQAELEYWIGK